MSMEEYCVAKNLMFIFADNNNNNNSDALEIYPGIWDSLFHTSTLSRSHSRPYILSQKKS